MTKELNKQQFIEMSKSNTRHVVAKYFGISDMTAQRIADELQIEFKKYKPKGRGKIKLV